MCIHADYMSRLITRQLWCENARDEAVWACRQGSADISMLENFIEREYSAG